MFQLTYPSGKTRQVPEWALFAWLGPERRHAVKLDILESWTERPGFVWTRLS